MAAPPPDRDLAKIIPLAVGHGHNGALGLRLLGYGDDWCEIALPYREELIGDPSSGVLASGPIVALMDMTAGMAVMARQGGFEPTATLDMRIDYLRAAIPGHTVTARCECYRVTRRIAFVRGLTHDGDPDDPIAHVAAAFMFTTAA